MDWRQQIKENNKIRECHFLGVLNVTPQIAQELLNHNIINRKLNQRRVALYAKDMKEAKWENIADGISISVDETGKLLNGQHRLNAIIKANVSIEMFVFEIKKNTNALLMPFDTNFTRSKAVLLQQNNTIVGIINFVGWIIGLSTLSAATVQKFEESLEDKEYYFLEKIADNSYAHKQKFPIAVKTAFFLSYILQDNKNIELLLNAFIYKDYNNARASELRDFVNSKSSETRMSRFVIFYKTYFIINDIPCAGKKYESQKILLTDRIKEWAENRF